MFSLECDELKLTHSGGFYFTENNLKGLVNYQGEVVIEAKYEKLELLPDGEKVLFGDLKEAYIYNLMGTQLLSFPIRSVSLLTQAGDRAYYVIETNYGKKALYDLDLNSVTGFDTDEIVYLIPGKKMYTAKRNDKLGVITFDGSVIIPFNFKVIDYKILTDYFTATDNETSYIFNPHGLLLEKLAANN